MTDRSILDARAIALEHYGFTSTDDDYGVYQVSRGKFQGELFFYRGNIVSAGFKVSNLALIEKSQLPEHTSAFYFHFRPQPLHVNGKTQAAGQLAALSAGSRFIAALPADFELYFLLINEEQLLRELPAQQLDRVRQLQAVCESFTLKCPQLTDQLQQRITRICEETRAPRTPAELAELAHAFEADILGHLASSDSLPQTRTPMRANRRVKNIDKALSYMLNTNLCSLKLAELIKNIVITQRSLELAFKQCLSCTPKECLTFLRLNCIRRELLDPNNDTPIRDIVHRYGLSHMGYFGQYYRALFNETPTETRKRAHCDNGLPDERGIFNNGHLLQQTLAPTTEFSPG